MLFPAIVGDSPSMAGACRAGRSVAAFDAAPPGAHLICFVWSLGRSLLASGDIPACRLFPSGGNHPPHSPLAGEPNVGARSVRALSPRKSHPRRGRAPLRRIRARLATLSLAEWLAWRYALRSVTLRALHTAKRATHLRSPRHQSRPETPCAYYAERVSRSRLRCIVPPTHPAVLAIPKGFRFLALRLLNFAANAALSGYVLREVVDIDAKTRIGT